MNRPVADNAFTLIGTLEAASLQDINTAVSLLVKAADVGLLAPAGTPVSAQQFAAQQQFLADTGSVITAVQSAGQFAVLGIIAFDVRVQQIKLNATDSH